MSLKSVLVTGSNRGIGLEMIRQLVAGHPALGHPRHVFACFRDPSKADELKNVAAGAKNETKVHLLQLEVTNDSQIADAVKYVDSVVGQDGLNLLINNAGTLEREGAHLPAVTRTNLLRHFDVNVASPILISQAFLPLLRRSASQHVDAKPSIFHSSIINVSSVAGSMGSSWVDHLKLGLGYPVSKAALNMGTKCLATHLSKENILCVSVSPGWVQTAMGGSSATSTPEQSVAELFNTLPRFNEEHQGGFFRRDGTPVPF